MSHLPEIMTDPYNGEPIKPLVNKPPLVRMGGKRYLADLIVGRINQLDYSMYVEPFIGGGRIYFEKQPAFVEIINDKEARVANFHFCARAFSEEMQAAQALLVKDENLFFQIYDKYHDAHKLQVIRDEIQTAREHWEKKDAKMFDARDTMVQHAIEFYFYSNMAFRGSLTAKTMTYFENDPRTETNRMRWRIFRPLFWMAERMRRTEVLNKDFTDIFENALKYSNHSRLWYLDPPYLGTEGYELEFTWEQYKQLDECLHKIPQSDYFLMSLNPDPKIKELFNWCHQEPVATHYTTGGAGQWKDAEELLITPPWAPKLKKQNESQGLNRFLSGGCGRV